MAKTKSEDTLQTDLAAAIKLASDGGAVPTVDVVRNLVGPDVSTDAIREALGQPVDVAVAAPPAIEIPDPLPPADARLGYDMAMAIVNRARGNLAEIEDTLAAAQDERSKLVAHIDDLIKLKDHELRVIESYSPQVAFAEGVKKIQAQTRDRLLMVKQKTAEAHVALQATGTLTYPSQLDASLASRKRTPEQKANLATFIHQTAQRQVAERG